MLDQATIVKHKWGESNWDVAEMSAQKPGRKENQYEKKCTKMG
jgi:hypothetical protein